MSRFIKQGNKLLKKLQGKDFLDDDGDIDVSLSVERSRQSSELAVAAQEYADDTAAEVFSKLLSSSQYAQNISDSVKTSSNDLLAITSYQTQAANDINTISSIKNTVASLGEALVSWPLYTTNIYTDGLRDASVNLIQLSGVLSSSGFEFTSETYFSLSPAYSGLSSTNTTHGRYLSNHPNSNITPLIKTTDDPISIEFLLNYSGIVGTTGYIIDFGNQYKVKIDTNDRMYFEHGGITSSSYVTLTKNTWDHYIISYNSILKSTSFFKNGQLISTSYNAENISTAPSSIVIFKNVTGYLNNLIIYKSITSLATAEALYNKVTSRFVDKDSGGILVSSDAGGNITKLVDPKTGIIDGKNIGRHIFGYNQVFTSNNANNRIELDNSNFGFFTNLASHVPFGGQGTAESTSINWYGVAALVFTKLPGENYIHFQGYHVNLDLSPPNARFGMYMMGGATYNNKIIADIETGNIGHRQFFSLSMDISGLADRGQYLLILKARQITGSNTASTLRWYSVFTGGSYNYTQVGAVAGAPPDPEWEA